MTTVTILFYLLCGTTALMQGVKWMGEGLEGANTEKIKRTLKIFTGNTLSSMISGTVITALVQSSTAIMVMTVGLVNARLMTLSQAIGIIYGTNIGTTVTVQLMSFHLSDMAFPAIIIGMVLASFCQSSSMKHIGLSILGFGFLFTGLSLLNASVPYIRESEFFYNMFTTLGNNPMLALWVGLFTTMLVQSSSATVGLTIVLFNAGLIDIECAVLLTMGDNIGTCATAQIASIGTSTAAKRVAWAHTLYNIIGVIIVLIFLGPFIRLVEYVTAILGQDKTRLIANTHTLFNILSAVLFYPITKYYIAFIEWLVRDKKSLQKIFSFVL
ncbi:MAG: Na/Pi cotransporter family protein [Clostridiaceae bacterium]|nr:Na/Pi cotransporter family protein [Clostridiaceae bacterium]